MLYKSLLVCAVSGRQFLLPDSRKPKLHASDRNGDSSVGAGGFESGNVNGFRSVCLSLCPECEAVARATWGTRKAKGLGLGQAGSRSVSQSG